MHFVRVMRLFFFGLVSFIYFHALKIYGEFEFAKFLYISLFKKEEEEEEEEEENIEEVRKKK